MLAKRSNGGAKSIDYQGQKISWAKLCDIKGIAKTQGGSDHSDVYNKARELHDSIQHDCSIDGIAHPTN